MHKISSPSNEELRALLPQISPTLPVIRNPNILHSPITSVQLENNAIKANVLLHGLLKTLRAKEAIVDSVEVFIRK